MTDETITIEPTEGLRCNSCERFYTHDDDTGGPLYECSRCGNRFNRDGSADGDSNRCPDCNIFAGKTADDSCEDCGDEELEQAEAYACPECEEWHEDAAAAAACCAEPEDNDATEPGEPAEPSKKDRRCRLYPACKSDRVIAKACGVCEGSGKFSGRECPDCDGKGRFEDSPECKAHQPLFRLVLRHRLADGTYPHRDKMMGSTHGAAGGGRIYSRGVDNAIAGTVHEWGQAFGVVPLREGVTRRPYVNADCWGTIEPVPPERWAHTCADEGEIEIWLATDRAVLGEDGRGKKAVVWEIAELLRKVHEARFPINVSRRERAAAAEAGIRALEQA